MEGRREGREGRKKQGRERKEKNLSNEHLVDQILHFFQCLKWCCTEAEMA